MKGEKKKARKHGMASLAGFPYRFRLSPCLWEVLTPRYNGLFFFSLAFESVVLLSERCADTRFAAVFLAIESSFLGRRLEPSE